MKRKYEPWLVSLIPRLSTYTYLARLPHLSHLLLPFSVIEIQVAFLKKELLNAMQAIDELYQANQVRTRRHALVWSPCSSEVLEKVPQGTVGKRNTKAD